MLLDWRAIAAGTLLLAGCAGGGGDGLEVTVESSGSCGSGGVETCVVLTASEPLQADVRIEDGLLRTSWTDVEVGPEPVDRCVCECTCAPGDSRGTVVVEVDGTERRRIDLGEAGDFCCESR